METITIQGDEVCAVSPEGATSSMKLTELFSKLAPRLPDSAEMVLPDGAKALVPLANGTIVVHQTPPRVYGFKWIANDSKEDFGDGTRYRNVRIALPYLVVLAVFEAPRGGLPSLSMRNECFFINQPLDTIGFETELHFPALLNCSRLPDDPKHPLSWICTQHLRPRNFVVKSTIERRCCAICSSPASTARRRTTSSVPGTRSRSQPVSTRESPASKTGRRRRPRIRSSCWRCRGYPPVSHCAKSHNVLSQLVVPQKVCPPTPATSRGSSTTKSAPSAPGEANECFAR